MKLLLNILFAGTILLGFFFQTYSYAYDYSVAAEAGYYSNSGSDSNYAVFQDGDFQTSQEIQMESGADTAYAHARSSLLSGSIGIELEAGGTAEATAKGTLAETLILDWDPGLANPFYVWVYWDVYGTYNAQGHDHMYTALNAAWGGIDALRIPLNNIVDTDFTDGEAHMSQRLTIDPTQSAVVSKEYNLATHRWETVYYDPHEIGLFATLEIRGLENGYARFGHTGTFNLAFSSDPDGTDVIDIPYASGSGGFLTEPECAVPLPASVLFFGPGLTFLAVVRRKIACNRFSR